MEHWTASFLENLPTSVLIIFIAAALYVLSRGADILVHEAVSLSVRWNIPKVLIGATVVSLGTTLPEASVSVAAAASGNPDIALGNAVGSIIADTSLIIGIAALIRPLPVQRSITDRQAWVHLGSVLLLAGIALPWGSISRGLRQSGTVPQWSGFLFLLLLAAYIYRTIQKARSSDGDLLGEEGEHPDTSPTPVAVLKLLLGLALIIASSRMLIPSVEITALRAGIPQSIIAATLVAFGTSLPELSTAVAASRKGHGELAIGNIIGADILNVLFVVGAAAAVTPQGLTVPLKFYWFHFPVMIAVVMIFRFSMLSRSSTVGRITGAMLVLFYIAYIVLSFTIIS